MFPKQYVEILESYLANRVFRIKQKDVYSSVREIQAGVPQGSVLRPVLYLLYTYDMPTIPDVTVATFADDTAILAVGMNFRGAADKLQTATNTICNLTKKWKINLNEMKSTYVNFTYKNEEKFPIRINDKTIPHANSAKYLGMNLDAALRWKEHIKKKRTELNLKLRKMYWMIGRKSHLSIQNKGLCTTKY